MGQFEIMFAARELPDETVDKIHENRDVSTETRFGLTMITVNVAGDEPLAAARVAVGSMESIDGVHIDRCCETLVDITDIADRAGVPVEVVSQWIQGNSTRTDAPFPAPDNLVAGGVWAWGTVNHWLHAAGEEVGSTRFPSYLDVVEINEWLASRPTSTTK